MAKSANQKRKLPMEFPVFYLHLEIPQFLLFLYLCRTLLFTEKSLQRGLPWKQWLWPGHRS